MKYLWEMIGAGAGLIIVIYVWKKYRTGPIKPFVYSPADLQRLGITPYQQPTPDNPTGAFSPGFSQGQSEGYT